MGENMIRFEGYEMLRAMYNFEATLAKTLSFNEGNHFILHHSNTKQRNWWQVVNNFGQVGFVPSNYVNSVKVEPLFLIRFLEESLAHLMDDPALTPDKQDLIAQLTEKKQLAELGLKASVKKQAPQPPTGDNHSHTNGKAKLPADVQAEQTEATNKASLEENTISSYREDAPPSQSSNEYDSHHNSDNSNSQDFQRQERLKASHSLAEAESEAEVVVTPRSQSSPRLRAPQVPSKDETATTLYRMVERVRSNTQLSHDLSRVAVGTILDCLKEVIIGEGCAWLRSLSMAVSSPGPLAISGAALRSSPDAQHLHLALSQLTKHQRDAQQRAWALHDDDQLITQHLQDVITILSNADVRVSKEVLSTEHYEYVNALVLFYQMETKWHIRKLLIQAFGVMCLLDRDAVRVLCNSVLVPELARDMMANPKDAPRLSASANLLSTVLSMGDLLPLSHFEQVDLDFVSFILQLIERPAATNEEEAVSDQFLTVVLALNLQFQDPDSNLVINALQSQSEAKIFTEKLLLLLNREDDPVKMLDHQPPAAHSVLKLSLDTFSRRTTAALFYTNDTRVLLDITVRQLADLSPGDRRRGMYLQLCLGVLRYTDYEHGHRRADLLRCFTRIFCEEGELSRDDQNLVRAISNEFPQYFKA